MRPLTEDEKKILEDQGWIFDRWLFQQMRYYKGEPNPPNPRLYVSDQHISVYLGMSFGNQHILERKDIGDVNKALLGLMSRLWE
jgi:hypothetical protein